MLETNDTQPAAADSNVVPSSETVEHDGQSPGAADTPDQVAETDEDKNARVLREQEAKQQKRRDAVQRRFDEMTAERRAKDRQIEQLLGVLQQQQRPPAQGGASQQQEGEPTRGQDEDYADWVARRAEWRAEQKATARVSAMLQERQQHEHAGRLATQAEQVRAQFETRMADFAKANPEFNEFVANNEDVEIPDGSVGLIHTLDDGLALLLAIGKNPKLAAELKQAAQRDGRGAPIHQAGVLGRISASLDRPANQVSNAPRPGSPVGSRGAPSGNTPSDSDSVDAWLRKRAAQLKARK